MHESADVRRLGCQSGSDSDLKADGSAPRHARLCAQRGGLGGTCALLERDGFTLVADPATADAVMVNTCGFIEAAKKDSIDTLLAASDLKKAGRARRSWPSGVWQSATVTSWPRPCRRLMPSSDSTITPTSLIDSGDLGR